MCRIVWRIDVDDLDREERKSCTTIVRHELHVGNHKYGRDRGTGGDISPPVAGYFAARCGCGRGVYSSR